MVAFAGSVQALFDVPAGGAAVSASNGSQSSAVTVTVPEDSYWLSSTYSQANLLSTFEDYLNDNVQGYPLAAAAMQALVGYGTWSAGWVINETAGNLAAAFGAPSLTANGSPTYVTGPRSGIDKAVGFDTASGANYFSGGDVHDADATSDLLIAIVFKVSTVAAGGADIIGKGYGGGLPGYLVVRETAELAFYVHDGVDEVRVAASGLAADTWYVGICALDRTGNQSRVGFAPLGGAATVSAATSTAAVGTIVNALNFKLGNNNVYNANPGNLYASALYVGTGVGAAGSIVTNLSTAVGNFANAINAAWSVTLGSDGRVTIANSHLPSSVGFTNTTLRNLLGFEYDFTYPQTAAQMALALGYGTWTNGVGYLFNESSGNLSSSFGTPATLTASGTPTYGDLGARGGSDKATGFDTNTEYFDGGSAHDIGANDDLLVVWVWKWDSLPSAYGSIFSKVSAAFGNGWAVLCTSDPYVSFFLGAGSAYQITTAASTAPFYKGQYVVGMACIDRSTGKARIGVRSLTDGSSTLSGEQTITGSFSNAATFRYGASAWTNTATQCEVSALYVVSGSGVAAGVSANMSTALSNFASYMKSQTGTQQARSIWYPDCPLFIADSDPRAAPVGSDARTSVSGTGERVTHVGVYHRYHRGLYWSHVPIDRIREASATYTNASFRTFWDDTQLARGDISWFRAGSSLLIVDHNGNVLGEDMQTGGPAEGWACTDPRAVEPKRVDPNGWTGLWRVEIPELIAKDE